MESSATAPVPKPQPAKAPPRNARANVVPLPEKQHEQPQTLFTGPLIYSQMSAAMADFAKTGLAKTRENREQKFSFRGIDELMNLAAPIFVKNHLLVLPEVLERVVSERETRSGGLMFNVALRVRWSFVSALDGSTHVVVTAGEASDSGDKATNKAQSASLKYALLQSFCIPLEGEGEDADARTPEESVVKTPNGYDEVVKGAEKAAKQGTDFLKAYARTVDRACWTHLVERDSKTYDVIKGAALDVDTKKGEAKP